MFQRQTTPWVLHVRWTLSDPEILENSWKEEDTFGICWNTLAQNNHWIAYVPHLSTTQVVTTCLHCHINRHPNLSSFIPNLGIDLCTFTPWSHILLLFISHALISTTTTSPNKSTTNSYN